MAFVTLTSSQKNALLADSGFQNEVKWGVLNKAAYWKGLDGTSLLGGVTPTTLARWAKSRQFAAQIQSNPSIADNTEIVKRFLIYVKNIACVDDQSAFDTTAVVTELVALSSFDTMADTWFDDQISTAQF